MKTNQTKNNKTTTNQIQIFEHENFGKIRIINIDGQPWFIGKDITDILGYSNPRKALIDHVDDEDKNTVTIRDGIPGNPNKTIINEPGLYCLILSSKLPQAKTFRRWVTSEVLPAIRKHGAYITEDTLEKMLDSREFTDAILEALAEEHAKNVVLENKVSQLTQKVRYCDRVLESGEAVPTSVIAKDYGMSAMAFNRLLNEMGIQYKLGGSTWLLYQEYAGKGYTKSKTFYTPKGECVVHTYWLQRGRQFVYNTLAAAGIYPLLEAIAIYQEYCEPDFVIYD